MGRLFSHRSFIMLVFLTSFQFVKAQERSIVPSLGLVFKHQENFAAPRLQVNANNIIQDRVGFYYTLEYRGGISFQEDGTSYYFRDLLGSHIAINENFGINLGVGMFRKGLLGKRENGRLRKEIGLSYQLTDKPWVVQIGYSTWVGPTFNFGYAIPL
jgi:hypothetical protein